MPKAGFTLLNLRLADCMRLPDSTAAERAANCTRVTILDADDTAATYVKEKTTGAFRVVPPGTTELVVEAPDDDDA